VNTGTEATLAISETEVGELALDIDGDGDTDVILTGNLEEDNISSLIILRGIIDELDIHKCLKKKLVNKIEQAKKDLERGYAEKAVSRLGKIIKHLEREIFKNIRDEGRAHKNHGNGNHHGKEKISSEDAETLIEIIKKIQYNLT